MRSLLKTIAGGIIIGFALNGFFAFQDVHPNLTRIIFGIAFGSLLLIGLIGMIAQRRGR